ncbi:two-component regulator propeller domain-containing protein [Parabacteroides sp. PF5-9]|uniref:two-component regulator propeller domain-containing protein n=1 Tax=Parabacteroides sp. PF5-9 TaxID=1742404 RepID=UPI0024737CFC|nr:two-component regulator propeller domain-containing protein [Parabacteroides sp. PF5-9]MDH6357828.1 signal transduction histidine kinase/ligand-binding sensor domain-containing protein/DNA-binding response OmpR family regulator [Parabacteroides sp. PF5-9]
MQSKKQFFFIVLICFCSQFISSANYKFNRLNVEHGLSNNEILCIHKDQSGFMWFGTPSGLNRYDGYEVITVKQDFSKDRQGNSNNEIKQIQESADHKLWIQTAFSYSVYDLKTERFEENVPALIEKYCGIPDFWSMYIDLGKNFWFVTWEDIRFYDIKTGQRKIFEQGVADGLSRGLVVDIKQGSNRYWFLFDNGLVECMDAQTHKIIRRDSTFQQMIPARNITTMRMFIDSSGDLWVYNIDSEYGIVRYDITENNWYQYTSSSTGSYYISHNNVFSIAEDDKGVIWVGTDHGGITLIDKAGKQNTVIQNDVNDQLSLPQNTIRSIYKDESNIMWMGTYKQGICYYHESIYKFKPFTDKAEIPYPDVNCFYDDPAGNIWIGSNGGGLFYFDRKEEKYTIYKHDPKNPNTPAGDVIVSLEYDKKGRLWIGYYLDGLDCFDGHTFTHYKSCSNDAEAVLTDNNVWNLHCDRNGQLWVGTLNGGILVIDTESGKRIRHLNTDGSVYAILEKKSGDILVGAQSGLYIYNPETELLNIYEKEIMGNAQIVRYDIYNLCEDSRGLLWIGTRNGLFVYNPFSEELRRFTLEEGLSADLIQSVQEDAEHNMWVATNRGLTYIRVSTNHETPGYFYHMINYDKTDGLQGEQFNYNASYMTSRSELIFGGMSGFNVFIPTAITQSEENPKVVLTGFQLFNRQIKPGEVYHGRKNLTQSITYTDEIVLNHSDNYFSLSFAALDYTKPDKVRYYYKLEGFNEEWLEADRISRKVTYTNLNPGNYVFHLKAVNNEQATVYPATLHVRIRPPFWQTTWAWIFYLLVVAGLLYLYQRRVSRKEVLKLKYAREKFHTEQRHEMDEMKLSFFTNISHEFRTPLTLILTPMEEMLKKEEDPEKKDSLKIMYRNAKLLLRLVNQVLDLRKIDAQSHQLQKSIGDIVRFLREQTDQFADAARHKNIRQTLSTNIDRLYMWFDADKLSKIITNILVNAHKFTPSGGLIEICLTHQADQIEIIIKDNGPGIPDEMHEQIFERFSQAKQNENLNQQGSGLGLHIAKEFVTMHNGSIWVENNPGGGCKFVIHLPCIQEEIKEEIEKEEYETVEEELHEENMSQEQKEVNKLGKLLIVDDNDDFRHFLTARLKDQYTVLQAADGVEGLEVAFREIPDMILTDVMMPRMDGIAMSKQLKGDIRTSHVPLILLTAKSGEESKLEGLSAGADDYITKPFNLEILQLKIHKLVETRMQTRKLFKEQIKIEPSKITVSSLDEKLIKKALEYTEKNISNPDFSVEELSRELGMSRVHLYKKISSLTGKTPIEFIRVIRLKRAAQLLKESQLTVSEVAYEVGFNNPKYFRKYFKEEFGVLPSQYGTIET